MPRGIDIASDPSRVAELAGHLPAWLWRWPVRHYHDECSPRDDSLASLRLGFPLTLVAQFVTMLVFLGRCKGVSERCAAFVRALVYRLKGSGHVLLPGGWRRGGEAGFGVEAGFAA